MHPELFIHQFFIIFTITIKVKQFLKSIKSIESIRLKKLYKNILVYYQLNQNAIYSIIYRRQLFKFTEMYEDLNIIPKQNRFSQNFIHQPTPKNRDIILYGNEQQNDLTLKSGTKLPPLRSTKNDDLNTNKTNQFTLLQKLQRKITEPDRKCMGQTQNTQIGRKFIVKRKTQKKRPIQQSFKPETILKNQQYINFLSYINISNNLKISCQQLTNPYIIYVGKGNNGSLIKNLFRTSRPWWIIQQNDPSQERFINLYWYQLRQNHILQQFKEIKTTYQDFQFFDYYIQDKEEKQSENNSRSQSKGKRFYSKRSQSLVGKDAPLMKRIELPFSKRNSSKSKVNDRSFQRIRKNSPSIRNHNIKQIKQQVLQPQINQHHKKVLTNPKMWPIYFMYRKIFSGSDMKKIKEMDIIQEDGKIHSKLLRNKMRIIQNRSNNIRMHNHVQNNWNLSNKKALFVNIKHYFQAQKTNPFQYIPMTFHVQKTGDKQYNNFVEQYQRRCEQIVQDQKNNKKSQYKTSFKPKKRNAWLVKPGENTNRGNGIEVVESLQQIKQILKDNFDSEGRQRTHIIQQYIMPFLYQKRKFDIRCYILITSVNGVQKGYWYQDGYIRTACKQFNMKNLSNRMIHLTNDAVQKKCEDYGKYEPGNKLSFSDFQRYLDANYNNLQNGQKLKFFQMAYPQMKKLAADAIKSVYKKINPNKKQFSFQIFGLDFLIDQNFKVWLIEANTNPCLQLSSPLLGRIIPSMLDNAFKIAIDPIFPPPPLTEIIKLTKKIVMPDNSIQNNKFQLVFDQIEQGAQLETLLTNAPQVQIFNIQQQQDQYQDSDRETD